MGLGAAPGSEQGGSWAALPSLLLKLLPMCLLQGFRAELASWWWVPLRVSGGVSGGSSPSKPPPEPSAGCGGLALAKSCEQRGGLTLQHTVGALKIASVFILEYRPHVVKVAGSV